jgi:hypothetical protein
MLFGRGLLGLGRLGGGSIVLFAHRRSCQHRARSDLLLREIIDEA